MAEVIQFNFVYANEAIDIKKFLGTIPRNISYVNYIDVVNKLTKNDYYQYEPSVEVVSSYLVKQLNIIIDKDPDIIYYVLSDLNEETIEAVKTYVESITDKRIKYNLYCHKNCSTDLNLFHEINKFE